MPKYTIHWASDDDVEDLARLETACQDVAWSTDDIAKQVNRKHDVSACCRLDNRLVGFMLTQRERRNINLLNCGTDPAFRRKGIQRALFRWISNRAKEFCTTASALVDERNLPALLCLKALDFKALHTVPEVFGKDDGIYFEYKLTND